MMNKQPSKAKKIVVIIIYFLISLIVTGIGEAYFSDDYWMYLGISSIEVVAYLYCFRTVCCSGDSSDEESESDADPDAFIDRFPSNC
ncbi:MAG: hypothetical protein K9W43_04840 [Candidatus Thorarchaeota archaeon]|nr:hypothetical protein [Candidatus Thorarchaeota archaeon]